MVEGGIALEPRRNVVLDPMMPSDFGQQLSYETRDFADALDGTLLAQMSGVLRFRLRAGI